jgi:acyl transferase domain-containing protein
MISMKAKTGRRTQISERLTQNSLVPPQGIRFSRQAGYTDEFMATTAFLFPGQGSQFAGMGKSLAEQYPAARAVFAEADEALGFSLSRLCFEGPEEDLKKTENTQPALLTVSIAAHSVLAAEGVRADFVAGHSLGEYSALVAAGALRFADAVRLVRRCRRGWARWRRCCDCPKARSRGFWSGRPRAKWFRRRT